MEELKSNEKQDLPIRQNLVDTAVGFLLNPNVTERPDDAKIAFLRNKGLTETEIAEAFKRVKNKAENAFAFNENSQMVNAYPLPPYQTSNSFWFHLRNYSSTFVSFAVAVYVLHRFYKSYLEPWLLGEKSEQSEISALKEQLAELNSSVSRLTSTVASLEDAVNSQMHKVEWTATYGVESVPKSVKDIQEEVSNVKSLLLNRFSFPAPPVLMGASVESKTENGESKPPAKVVSIPKWQLRVSEHEKSNADSDEQLDESMDKFSSAQSSLENDLSPVKDQTQDQENSYTIAKDSIQNENSETALEDQNEKSKECLENGLSAEGEIGDEDSEKSIENPQIKNVLDKIDDSGIEMQNYSSDSESSEQANERSVSTEIAK